MSRSALTKLGTVLICLTLLGLVMGCQSENPGKKDATQSTESATTPVIRYTTLYYRNGPQQAMPPDGTFEAGTPVEVIQGAGSYSLVRAQDGRQGYVSTDAIAPGKEHP